jgi:RNA polymerase subunit RPABC4/transcription elongation factor Spt4
MPKQCPECKSITTDEIGYCPACGFQLAGCASSSLIERWRYMAVAVASGSVAATILYFLWSSHRL